jgi:hypothetical protein
LGVHEPPSPADSLCKSCRPPRNWEKRIWFLDAAGNETARRSTDALRDYLRLGTCAIDDR